MARFIETQGDFCNMLLLTGFLYNLPYRLVLTGHLPMYQGNGNIADGTQLVKKVL